MYVIQTCKREYIQLENTNRQILLQIQWKQMAISVMLNVWQNIWIHAQNNLHTFVRCCAPPSDFFFSVSRLPQNLILESLHSSPTARSLGDDEW